MFDKKTYYEKNKEKYKQSMRDYYTRNKDKLQVDITCKICKSVIQYGSLNSHIKTKIHNSFLPSGHNRTIEECYI